MKNLFSLIATGTAALVFTTAQAQAPVKKVLLEEFTTTLCGMCPPQSHVIKDWHENHTSNSILMVHHAGFGTDSMTNTVATTACNYFQPSTFGFAPAIMIDRDVYPWNDSVPYMSCGGFDSIADRVSQDPAVVGIDIQGTYNSATRALSVTATATFVQNMPSYNRRIMIYLVEDSIIGNGSGWDQKCYSSTFANTYYPGQWNAQTTYISNYPHRYVVRAAISGGVWGTSNIIPSTPTAGTPYSVSANYTIPGNMNVSRMKVVAFVAEYGPNKLYRQVLNANDVHIATSFNTTITSVSNLQPATSGFSVMPNPTNGMITLEYRIFNSAVPQFNVINVFGQVVYQTASAPLAAPGLYQESIDLSWLDAGVYFIVDRNGVYDQSVRILKQ